MVCLFVCRIGDQREAWQKSHADAEERKKERKKEREPARIHARQSDVRVSPMSMPDAINAQLPCLPNAKCQMPNAQCSNGECTNGQMHKCSNTKCTNAQTPNAKCQMLKWRMHKWTNAQMLKNQMPKCQILKTLKRSNAQMLQHTTKCQMPNVPMFQWRMHICTNALKNQMPKCQMLKKRSSAQMLKCSKRSKRSNAQMLKSMLQHTTAAALAALLPGSGPSSSSYSPSSPP